MTAAPKVLAFDTSGPYVAIATSHDSYAAGQRHDMARGQAEALMPLLEQTLAACQWTWQDLSVIGVGVGPGNFTGIRIAVSAARGLGLALDVPVLGLTAFEIAYGHHKPAPWTLMSLPAPRDMAYVQIFGDNGAPMLGTGQLIDPEEPPADLPLHKSMTVQGHRAAAIHTGLGLQSGLEPNIKARVTETLASFPDEPNAADATATRMAEITEMKFSEMSARPAPPAPNYIKPPDAAPARDTAPTLLP